MFRLADSWVEIVHKVMSPYFHSRPMYAEVVRSSSAASHRLSCVTQNRTR